MRIAALSFLLLGSLACAPGDAGTDAGPDGGASSSDVDTYSAGMMKMGDALHVVLVEASPAPPDVGNNTWTLRITDMNDDPVEDAVVVVSPFMPEHQHGTSPPDYEGAPTETMGEHTVGPFDLVMPGLWEIRVSVTTPADLEDEVVFRFDVEG